MPPSRTVGTSDCVVSPPTVSNATSTPLTASATSCCVEAEHEVAVARRLGADRPRARELRKLNREVTDAAGGARDQRRLPTLEPAAVKQRYRRRLLVGHGGGLSRDRGGGGGRELRVAAACSEAEHLVSLGKALGARHIDRPGHVHAEHRG